MGTILVGPADRCERMESERGEAFYNRSLERALRIVTVFTNERRSLTLAQLSELLDLSKATVSRLCSTLVKFDFLCQDAESKQYSLGIKLFELGSLVGRSFSLARIASPYLTRWEATLRRVVFLGILDGGELLYIDKREDVDGAVSFTSQVGRRRPPYWGMVGPAIMAFLQQEEIDGLIEKTPLRPTTKRSLTTRAELETYLRRVRERGYAVDDGKAIEGVGGVGAPVRDFSGRVVGGVGVSFIVPSVDARELRRIIKTVLETAWLISRAAGYKGKEPSQV
jgi:DNA-binding IclR family transcriptional regulator